MTLDAVGGQPTVRSPQRARTGRRPGRGSRSPSSSGSSTAKPASAMFVHLALRRASSTPARCISWSDGSTKGSGR